MTSSPISPTPTVTRTLPRALPARPGATCPEELWAAVPQADRDALRGVLANDPRPSYQHDPARVYGMEFGGLEVHFTVDDPVLTVRDITRR